MKNDKKSKLSQPGNLRAFLSGKERSGFNFFDVKPLNREYKTNRIRYFTRMPNCFLQQDITEKYSVHRIMPIIYILIDKKRSVDDKSYLTLEEVFETCGYKQVAKKPKIFYEILKVLIFFEESNLIEIDDSFLKNAPNNLSYKTLIPITVISDNFDTLGNFTILTTNEFECIMQNNTTSSNITLLLLYLYVKSYIYNRPKDEDGNEAYKHPDEHPEAFWGSIRKMSADLGMSTNTIMNGLNVLCSPFKGNEPLLVKYETGMAPFGEKKEIRKLPNIYVLNNKNAKQEIKWAIPKVKQMFLTVKENR